jgi:hypothetical protein
MFEGPQQLRADHASEDAGDGGVHAMLGQPGSPQLAPEDPEPDQRSERDERAEAGDLERTDAKQDGIDVEPPDPLSFETALLCCQPSRRTMADDQEAVMQAGLTLLGIAVIALAGAQQAPDPRQPPSAAMRIYAPDQHDLYDGHFVLSATRIYMVGALEDRDGWDHLDNEAKSVHPVAGTAEIDVDEIRNTGTFEAKLKIPEGDLVLTMDRWNEFSPCQDGGIAAYVHEHGADSGCGDNNWPKTLGFLAGWGFGHATLNGKPLYQDYEMHFMVTQGLRDRKTLRVNYPMPDKKLPGGETNPATQQIDFYIRSPQQNAKNRPNRQVFVHFFGMEVTWK